MLVLHHDVTSPASAIAVARLQRLADEGLPVRFNGVDVLGLAVTLPVTLDVLADLERLRPVAAAHGVVLGTPTRRPPTAAVHLLGELAHDAGLGAAWRAATYRAYWRDDADLGDDAVLVGIADRVGLDADVVTAALADGASIAAFRRRGAAIRQDGVGGVPVLEAHGTLLPADLDDDALRELGGW
jgi:2-hydroxychromene-2-carboxylate isomerase